MLQRYKANPDTRFGIKIWMTYKKQIESNLRNEFIGLRKLQNRACFNFIGLFKVFENSRG